MVGFCVGRSKGEPMILLAILLPPIALLAMKRYVEFAVVLILWLAAFPAMLFFLLPGIALWSLCSMTAMFYVNERSTARHFDRIGDAITRASERVAPQSIAGEPPPSYRGPQYSAKTDHAADEILGGPKSQSQSSYKSSYQEPNWTYGKDDGLHFSFGQWRVFGLIVFGLLLIPVATYYGPPWMDYAKSKWDEVILSKPKDDMASLVRCCQEILANTGIAMVGRLRLLVQWVEWMRNYLNQNRKRLSRM